MCRNAAVGYDPALALRDPRAGQRESGRAVELRHVGVAGDEGDHAQIVARVTHAGRRVGRGRLLRRRSDLGSAVLLARFSLLGPGSGRGGLRPRLLSVTAHGHRRQLASCPVSSAQPRVRAGGSAGVPSACLEGEFHGEGPRLEHQVARRRGLHEGDAPRRAQRQVARLGDRHRLGGRPDPLRPGVLVPLGHIDRRASPPPSRSPPRQPASSGRCVLGQRQVQAHVLGLDHLPGPTRFRDRSR